jgi:hypothetical protein
MAIGNMELGAPVNLSASGQVAGGTAMARTYVGGANDPGSQTETTALQGAMLGFFVASNSSGVITLTAGTSSGGATLLASFTIPALGWYYFPIISPTGIYFTLSSGSANITFCVVE